MRKRVALLAGLLILIAAFFALDLDRYLSLDALQAQRGTLVDYRDARPVLTASLFFVTYVVATALSIPGAAVLTLAAGAIFGLFWGTVLVSFASTIGATGAFLVARYLFRDVIERRYRERLDAINAGIARDGAFYLFTLRLVPVFPFFLINLLLGLTQMPARTFFWVSQIGMLAGTVVYVNAGTQLAQLSSLRGILSPGLIGAFVLLGIFPLLARRLVDGVKARRVYAPWRRPARFDRNLIVIGAGSAGLVSAYIAAALRARVTLIEKHRMGGDCLNTGCVPSKTLIRAARLASEQRRGPQYGLPAVEGKPDFAAVMERVQRVIAAVEPHDSVQRYETLGVECLHGEARLVDPWTVEIGDRRLTARNIVLATGARPFVPPIPGLAEAGYLTSDTVWQLRTLPARLVVLGGGPIGCELAQAFARLGAQVTQVERGPRLLPREDPEVSALLAARLAADGVDVRLDTEAQEVQLENGDTVLLCSHGGAPQRIACDRILVAVGRAANLTGYGLQELGVRTGRTVQVNDFLQTNFPNIYACGDVAGPYQFTHTAAHMAWYATVNSLLGPLLALRGGRFRVDYSTVPWVTFVDPEVARVGLNETEAHERGIPHEVTVYPLDDLDRAIAEGDTDGFVKVLTVPGRDRILGVTLVGAHAGELLAEYVLAMRHRIGLNKILSTIHPYPTWAEANKYAAGRWRQAHAPQALLRWAERFHAWRRA
ncbi:MAG TPA: FAD-dependent oxidoreductase [Rhodocyclaceae bacterium]|nr:FAD-dependent oxidoreductase [Rhodocyclaceae bacterium]